MQSNRSNSLPERLSAAAFAIACLSFAVPLGPPTQVDYQTAVLVLVASIGLTQLPLVFPGGNRLYTLGMPAVVAAALLPPVFAAVALGAGVIVGLALAAALDRSAWAQAVAAAVLTGIASLVVQAPELEATRYGLAAAATVFAAGELLVIRFWRPSYRWLPLVAVVPYLMVDYLGQICVGLATVLLLQAGDFLFAFILVALSVVLQVGFKMLIRVQSAAVQTLLAAVRLAEMQDGASFGHAERVVGLSSDAARRLGLRGRALEDVALVALVHDVGQLRHDPLRGTPARDVASASADIVSRMPSLGHLSATVADTGLPWAEWIEEGGDRGRIARLVHAASALDDHVQKTGDAESARVFLAQESGVSIDPDVAAALSRTLA